MNVQERDRDIRANPFLGARMRNPRFSSAARRGGAASRPFPRGILARPRDASIAPDNGRLAHVSGSRHCSRSRTGHRCPKSPLRWCERAARPAEACARGPPQSLTPEAGAYRHRTTQESLTDLVSVYECYLSRARGWCAFSIVPHLWARWPIGRQTHGGVGLTSRSLVQNLSLLGVGDV